MEDITQIINLEKLGIIALLLLILWLLYKRTEKQSEIHCAEKKLLEEQITHLRDRYESKVMETLDKTNDINDKLNESLSELTKRLDRLDSKVKVKQNTA